MQGSAARAFVPERFALSPLSDDTPLLSDAAALRAAAVLRGYLFFRQLVSAAALGPVRAFVRAFGAAAGWVHADDANPPWVEAVPGVQLAGRGFDDPAWIRLQQDLNRLPAFHALGEDPRVLEVLGAVYGEPARGATTHLCWIKLPGSPQHTTLPHQDRYYVPACEDLWTAWYPLVPTPFALGPLAVIAGSHRSGLWHHTHALAGIDVPDGSAWDSSEVLPGDVLLFGGLTVHAGWANVSADRVRVSADVRFRRASSPPGVL